MNRGKEIPTLRGMREKHGARNDRLCVLVKAKTPPCEDAPWALRREQEKYRDKDAVCRGPWAKENQKQNDE